MKLALLFLGAAAMVGGCATSFTGSPHVSKEYCQKFCSSNGLIFSGMVALGQYSSGCVCSASRTSSIDPLASAGAGAVGVITQMRAAQQAAAAAHR